MFYFGIQVFVFEYYLNFYEEGFNFWEIFGIYDWVDVIYFILWVWYGY